ncbi:MAG: type II toxin-antitoxin system HicB family antitoxin [Rhodopirellula sp. JB055]|jgi:predicted RNase H-like HicB family nuclease|uniref:type II toxin-antitoxin system HicB family antitoxin n=1 Tax=Rhodopirellula sp. JB055 TaxID=3342846 RepID=UPI00370B4185
MINEAVCPEVVGWRYPSDNCYTFEAVLTPDEDGGFVICAKHYPGIVSDGDSADEAIQNIQEAFLALAESRKAHNESMMYSEEPVVEIESDSKVIRILIDGQ